VVEERYKNHMIFEGIEDYYTERLDQKVLETIKEDTEAARTKNKSLEEQFDYLTVERYCEEIEKFLSPNDFGALKADIDSLAQHYSKKKNEQCNGYSGEFNVEETFLNHYGAAVSEAAIKHTQNCFGEPDIEDLIREMLEQNDSWYYEKDATRILMNGAYEWRKNSSKNE